MKKKARKRAGTPEAKELGEWLRDIRKGKLTSPGKKEPGISQQELAQRLGVERSTVTSWEHGDYKPSPETLIKLGNQLSFPEAFDPWKRAGLDLPKLQLWTGPVAPKTFRLTAGLFPFQAGDVVGVDESAIDDIWGVIGSLVVVEFNRYPARVEVELSQRWLQQRRERGTKVDLAELEQEEAIRRAYAEQDGGLTALERAARDDEQHARNSKLLAKWTPDKHGLIDLRHIQAGWLRLRLAEDPDFSWGEDPAPALLGTAGPWQLVLQGASVRGITGGANVPLTDWETSRKGTNIKLIEKLILGRVSYWMRATGSEVSAGGGSARTAFVRQTPAGVGSRAAKRKPRREAN